MIRSMRAWLGWAILLLACSAVSSVRAQEEVCEDFPLSRQVRRFGGSAISSERANTADDLRRLMQRHRSEMEQVLRSKGLEHLVDALYEAIETGEGVIERNLYRGETLQWMAARRDGVPTAGDPVCIAVTAAFEAFEIRIQEEEIEPAEAKCALRAEGDCRAGTIEVDSSGSSEGVEVTMSGGGRSVNLVAGEPHSWSADFENRYDTDYAISVRAGATGKRTVKTHTFVLPKICLNLSYVGEPTVVEEELTDTCTETVAVSRCEAKIPGCTISFDPSVGRTGQEIRVRTSGHWDPENPEGLVVPVRGPDGSRVAELKSFPTTVSFQTPGTYVFEGTATNEAGVSRSCSAELVVDPRFTLRGCLARIDLNADDLIRTTPVDQTKFSLHTGVGLCADFEYHYRPTIGLAATLIAGSVDSWVKYDTANVWEMNSSDLDFLSLTLGPNFHFRPGRRVDPYVGVFVGFVDFGVSHFVLPSTDVELDLGSDLAVGSRLGLDIALGPTQVWAAYLGARYMVLASDEVDDLEINPFLVEAGIARRF